MHVAARYSIQNAYADNVWSCPALLTAQSPCGSALIMVAPGKGRDQLLTRDSDLILFIVSLPPLSLRVLKG